MGNTDDLIIFDELKENGELNETETHKVISIDWEKSTTFLDMRLLWKSSVMDLTGWKDSKQLPKKHYIEFYATAAAYNSKESNTEKEAYIVIDDAET